MGLFSTLGASLIKVAVDSASGIEYVSKEEINSKVQDFSLHYKHLLNKATNFKDKMEIVVIFAMTAIAVSKSDGSFSDSEITELISLMDLSTGGLLPKDDALEIIRDLNAQPVSIEDLASQAIKLSSKYGEIAIVALRKFIEFMIYSDGEVHPKELEFLNNWNTTLDIKSKYF